jgi:hypothetical protein
MVKLTVLENGEKKKLENPGGDKVLAKVGGKGAGLPFFAFVDPKGELIVNAKRDGQEGQNIGYPMAPGEIDWFLVMLKKSAPKMTADQTRIIEEWLRSQKR